MKVQKSDTIVGRRELCRLHAGVQGLRELCTENGSLLCFDEVMTGFRIAKGCAQEHFGITPDLTTVRLPAALLACLVLWGPSEGNPGCCVPSWVTSSNATPAKLPSYDAGHSSFRPCLVQVAKCNYISAAFHCFSRPAPLG